MARVHRHTALCDAKHTSWHYKTNKPNNSLHMRWWRIYVSTSSRGDKLQILPKRGQADLRLLHLLSHLPLSSSQFLPLPPSSTSSRSGMREEAECIFCVPHIRSGVLVFSAHATQDLEYE
eukprot:1916629-Pyramimonas_sp.AAC.1